MQIIRDGFRKIKRILDVIIYSLSACLITGETATKTETLTRKSVP